MTGGVFGDNNPYSPPSPVENVIGPLNITTAAQDPNSGLINIETGQASNLSGDILLTTGVVGLGGTNSGSVVIQTGNTGPGVNSGAILIQTGLNGAGGLKGDASLVGGNTTITATSSGKGILTLNGTDRIAFGNLFSGQEVWFRSNLTSPSNLVTNAQQFFTVGTQNFGFSTQNLPATFGTGDIFLESGAVANDGNIVPSGRVSIQSGPATGVGNAPTGEVRINSGNTWGGKSGNLIFSSGFSSQGDSGNIVMSTGTGAGSSGNITISSGGSDTQPSGSVNLRSGNSNSSATGSVGIATGNASTISGNITIVTGTGPTRGHISMLAGFINHNAVESRNVVWESDTTANRPVGPVQGQRFFDTTLGRPIWYDGANWILADGTVV